MKTNRSTHYPGTTVLWSAPVKRNKETAIVLINLEENPPGTIFLEVERRAYFSTLITILVLYKPSRAIQLTPWVRYPLSTIATAAGCSVALRNEAAKTTTFACRGRGFSRESGLMVWCGYFSNRFDLGSCLLFFLAGRYPTSGCSPP